MVEVYIDLRGLGHRAGSLEFQLPGHPIRRRYHTIQWSEDV